MSKVFNACMRIVKSPSIKSLPGMIPALQSVTARSPSTFQHVANQLQSLLTYNNPFHNTPYKASEPKSI